ncbi:hypothetical protein D3C85_1774610 [compost metagenome]
MQAEMICRALPILAEHPARMCVIYIDNSIILLRKLHDRWQRSDIAIHAKNAIRHNDALLISGTFF